MSQDIVSDGLNQMMNAVKAGKNSLVIKHRSKVLTSILAIAKLKGYISSYSVQKDGLHIGLNKLNGCRAIKPRSSMAITDVDKYIARYLPAKDMGVIVISTSQGLMTHQTAIEKNIGGSLIAFMY